MPNAEIVTIGTELLLGDITDTNARYLAQSLTRQGIDLYRITAIGDNVQRIAEMIKESIERADIVITTGGLGPTVDDPTRQAVADATGSKIVFHAELWDQILERFKRYARRATENNKRQAYIPEGAIAIENPVGTAPAFIKTFGSKVIISLPGVPREMEYLMENSVIPFLRDTFHIQEIIKSRVIHTCSAGESQIDDKIGDLEKLSNPTVGLLAHPGQTDIRITAKANSESLADKMIAEIEAKVRERVGKYIYGVDQEKLEDKVAELLEMNQLKLVIAEHGLDGQLIQRLSGHPGLAESASAAFEDPQQMIQRTSALYDARKSGISIGAMVQENGDQCNLTAFIVSPFGKDTLHRSYGGPKEYTINWSVNFCLDFIRQYLLTIKA